jgi:hypothetical protein
LNKQIEVKFLRQYKSNISLYKKNTIYERCNVNEEMNKIFISEKLQPIFRIENDFRLENNYCYSIWLVKDLNNNFSIYFSLIDKYVEKYRNSGTFLYKNKELNKIKSIKIEYVTMKFKNQTDRKHKKDFFLKKINKGILNLYNYKLTNIQNKTINKIMKKITETTKKENFACNSDKLINYEIIPTIRYITSTKFNFIQLEYPDYQLKNIKREDLNKSCLSLKILIDYIFELSKNELIYDGINRYNKELNEKIVKYMRKFLLRTLRTLRDNKKGDK